MDFLKNFLGDTDIGKLIGDNWWIIAALILLVVFGGNMGNDDGGDNDIWVWIVIGLFAFLLFKWDDDKCLKEEF